MMQLSVAGEIWLEESWSDGLALCSSLESLGFALHVLLQCFCYSWLESENSVQQKTFFLLSNVCFHFFSDLKLLTLFRMGKMEGYDYIHPKPSLSSGLDWDDSDSEPLFSLFGLWVKSRWYLNHLRGHLGTDSRIPSWSSFKTTKWLKLITTVFGSTNLHFL